MGALYKEDAEKKPTNLSINSDLMAKSWKMQINLSVLLEVTLTEKITQAENEKWQARNKLAGCAIIRTTDFLGNDIYTTFRILNSPLTWTIHETPNPFTSKNSACT